MSKHELTEIRIPIEKDNPSIVRDENKCVACGLCRYVCENDITVGALYNLEYTGDNAICINCGQCGVSCPTDSITEKFDYKKVASEIASGDKIVIFTTAPAVRISLGEEFGLPAGEFVEGKMISALRALGGKYVLDANFGADMTIMEEASELALRLKNKSEHAFPMFTSCCPSWVKYVETFFPQLMTNLSSTRSPILMMGATIKTYFAKKMNLDASKIINVAIAPCTAKKFEITRPEMNASGKYLGNENIRDVDYVLTTRELAKWIKDEKIFWTDLPDGKFDNFMGQSSGGGVIFGSTGGVMESAVRTAYFLITGNNLPDNKIDFTAVRGMENIKQAVIEIGTEKIKIAVANGMIHARNLIEKILSGEEVFDFVEVMNCRGGCIAGGGQPKTTNVVATIDARISGLYNRDKNLPVRCAHDNPEIKNMYAEFFGAPLSDIAHKLLHTTFTNRSGDLKK
ncbi:MAG: [FeFe] hydrogenase, group A [Rickettsiales bacterium]|jgi:ferredoxin hydrogenase|nr:[FeFe] hydrogenase, group A [Rickettsiales bacterium]